MTIISGTTVKFEYTFTEVNPADMTVAYFSVKQLGKTVVLKDLDTATIESGKLSWTLTQAESLSLKKGTEAYIYLDYVLRDGTRGAGETETASVIAAGKNEVI